MREKVKLSDEELALRAQGGDELATEELLLRYKNTVLARARKFFLEDGETEDLVQEGMIGLYKAVCGYRKEMGKSFKNFAYLCVNRRIYDELKKASRHKVETDETDPDHLIDDNVSPEGIIIDEENKLEFRAKLLKVLSDYEYRVLTLYLDGMPYATIAEATGKPLKSIDNALSRAKRKITENYSKDIFHPWHMADLLSEEND